MAFKGEKRRAHRRSAEQQFREFQKRRREEPDAVIEQPAADRKSAGFGQDVQHRLDTLAQRGTI